MWVLVFWSWTFSVLRSESPTWYLVHVSISISLAPYHEWSDCWKESVTSSCCQLFLSARWSVGIAWFLRLSLWVLTRTMLFFIDASSWSVWVLPECVWVLWTNLRFTVLVVVAKVHHLLRIGLWNLISVLQLSFSRYISPTLYPTINLCIFWSPHRNWGSC